MTKQKNAKKSIWKQINSEIVKLSWVYIIAISLIAVVIVQLYRGTFSTTQPTQSVSTLSQLEQKINTLTNTVETLQHQTKTLEEKIQSLQNP